jgi:hypothetical protein
MAMKNILVIAAKADLIFDPRDIQGSIEKPFEEWLTESFEFLIFHTNADFANWRDKESEMRPDRFWAELPLPDRRKGPWRKIAGAL